MHKKNTCKRRCNSEYKSFNYYDHFLDCGLVTHPRLVMSRIDNLLHRKRSLCFIKQISNINYSTLKYRVCNSQIVFKNDLVVLA